MGAKYVEANHRELHHCRLSEAHVATGGTAVGEGHSHKHAVAQR